MACVAPLRGAAIFGVVATKQVPDDLTLLAKVSMRRACLLHSLGTTSIEIAETGTESTVPQPSGAHVAHTMRQRAHLAYNMQHSAHQSMTSR
jgi:hypothetical protein